LEQTLWRRPVGEHGFLLHARSGATGSFFDVGELRGANEDAELAAARFEPPIDSRHARQYRHEFDSVTLRVSDYREISAKDDSD
jgi:hypothetical protein